MEGRVCVITGATAGIGRATADELARRGATVVILGRTRGGGGGGAERDRRGGRERERRSRGRRPRVAQQVRRAAAEIVARHPHVHVLINNAGVFPPARIETEDGIEQAFAVNYLSHFLLTQPCSMRSRPGRRRGRQRRLEGAGRQDRLRRSDVRGAQVLDAARGLGVEARADLLHEGARRRLDGSGVTANALHPGLTKTAITQDMSAPMRTVLNLVSGTPEKGARTSVYLATSDEVNGVSGQFFVNCKQQKMPSRRPIRRRRSVSGTSAPARRARRSSVGRREWLMQLAPACVRQELPGEPRDRQRRHLVVAHAVGDALDDGDGLRLSLPVTDVRIALGAAPTGRAEMLEYSTFPRAGRYKAYEPLAARFRRRCRGSP